MKSQISQLRNEKNLERVESLSMDITQQLKTDELLLQPYLEVALTSVLPNFWLRMQVDIKHECFDSFLYSPKFQVLSVIVSCLKQPQSKKISTEYLAQWAKRCLFWETMSSVQEHDKMLYDELLSLIFSIPDRVASAFGSEGMKAYPSCLRSDEFFDALASSLHRLDSQVLSKFAVLKLMKYIWKMKFRAVDIAPVALEISSFALSPFLLSLLEDAPKQMCSSVLSVVYPQIERAREILGYFLTQKVVSDKALNLIVDFRIGQGEIMSTLEQCANIWSRHRLITQMSTALHRQLSLAILKLLQKVDAKEFQNSKSAGLIMSGVSAHISITSPEIRRFGLEIGERTTEILIPGQAVKFDELHPKEEEDNDELKPGKLLNESESDSDTSDIDAPFEPERDDSEDELIPYAIDDTPASDVNKILHPRDLIALYRTDENDVEHYKKFSRALSSSVDVIQKMTQLEFDEFGLELLQTLMNIENQYNDKEFDDLRQKAFVAFMSKFPEPAAKLVVRELQRKRTYSLGRKIQLISALSYAASEMSELPKPEKEIIATIEAHTKRRGRAKTKITRYKGENKFAKCAVIYFYGIIQALDLDKIALEEDGLEIGQALTTLGIIIESCGGNVTNNEQMCNDLLQVALALSTARAPNARRALLFAVSCAVRNMKDHRTIEPLLIEYLVKSAQDDPDELCRDLAQSTCIFLREKENEEFESLFKMP